ncbi:MAG: pilus assembly PilX N-terminal domain-containing protein [Myxococcota bacterium]
MRGLRRSFRFSRALKNERGSLLIIALMVLLALTSVAFVAVQSVSSALGYAGNTRRGASAFRVTEGGAFTALAFASSLGADTFVASVDESITSAGKAVWSSDHMVPDTDWFDLTASGSFGFEGSESLAAATAYGSPGVAPYEMRVNVAPTGMRQPLVGYSIGGKGARCRFKYRLDAEGRVGQTFADAGEEAAFEVWQRVRATTFVGPLTCDQATGTIGRQAGT